MGRGNTGDKVKDIKTKESGRGICNLFCDHRYDIGSMYYDINIDGRYLNNI